MIRRGDKTKEVVLGSGTPDENRFLFLVKFDQRIKMLEGSSGSGSAFSSFIYYSKQALLRKLHDGAR